MNIPGFGSRSFVSRIPTIFLLFGTILLFFSPIVKAAEGDFVWAHGFGESGQVLDDVGQNIFVDSVGNVYATGYFRGTVDFDPGPGNASLTSTGDSRDVYIIKMNSGGSLVWAKAIVGASFNEGYSIYVDSSGNVYTTGYFVGTADFDPDNTHASNVDIVSSEGSSDIFISKLDSSGNFAGVWTMGGTATDYGFGIFVDPSGNIYTTGYFQNTVDFDPDNTHTGDIDILTSAGDSDIFISRLNNDGTFGWAKRIGGGGTADDEGLGISRYSSGHLYVTGWFQGLSVDFDPADTHAGNGDLLTSSGFDIFVLKLADDGSFAWAKAMGGVSDDRGQAVAVDGSGNVYTTGWFNGTADFDRDNTHTGNIDQLTSSGGASDADIFVSKLKSDGSFGWARSMGAAGSADSGYGIFADASGNVYATGVFGNTADFDPGTGTSTLESAGGYDVFISKLYGNGSFGWAKRMGGSLDDYGYDIFVDRLGAVHTTGYFQGTVDFDPGTGTHDLVSAGSFDIFISKLSGRDYFPWNLFLPAILGNKQP